MKYEYPASQYIQSYAPYDKSSHFYAKGSVEFDSLVVDCDFEVVCTHNCDIVVILYFDIDDFSELFGHKDENSGMYSFGGSISNNHFKRLTGVELRSGQEIVVEDGFLRKLGFINSPTIFTANSLCSTNNHLVMREYYPNKGYYVFEVSGIDLNTDFMTKFPFSFGEGQLPFYIEAIYQRKRQYDNQPLVRLLIPKESLPNGWQPEELADLWCALVSLAIGRDVRWLKMEVPSDDRILTKWVMRTNVLGMEKFVGLISAYELEQDAIATIAFIKCCFEQIWQDIISPSIAAHYTLAIRHYVSYRLMKSRTEDNARLISTTVEELLGTWESSQGLEPENIVTNEELTAIRNASKTSLQSTINGFNGDKKRKDKIRKKIDYLVRRELSRMGFEDRLERYFLWPDHKVSESWYDSHVSVRLPYFVGTRDMVVHVGKFPTEDNKVKFWYYYNLSMILPLMVFALFRYDAPYIDLIEYWKDGIEAPPSDDTDETSTEE